MKARRTSRLWTTLSLLMLVALTACAGPAATAAPTSAPPTAEPPKATGPVVVLEWSGYELPEFNPDFISAHPEVNLEYSFFAETAESFAKVQSGFEADLVHPCTNYWQLFVDSGLVQPIDISRLKNWPGVRPALAKQGEFNGKQYFIPWDWGYESILIRTDKVKDAPKSWADLWNPAYKGHLSLYDSGEASFIMAGLSLGFDPWHTTPEQTAQIKQRLIDIRPNLLNYWSDFAELGQLIESGDIWVASNAWNSTYFELRKKGVPVDYLVPKEGRLGWLCGYGILSTSQNVDLAYEFIDARLAADSMAYLSNAYGYGSASEASLAKTDPETITLLELDQPDILNRTNFYQSLSQEQRELFTNVWGEVKSAP